MAHGQHAPRRARLGRRNGCASGREAAGQIRQELGHYAVGRVEGQLGPRRANLVPKYYGVNTVDEILTAGGDDWHRPKFPVTPVQRPSEVGLESGWAIRHEVRLDRLSRHLDVRRVACRRWRRHIRATVSSAMTVTSTAASPNIGPADVNAVLRSTA